MAQVQPMVKFAAALLALLTLPVGAGAAAAGSGQTLIGNIRLLDVEASDEAHALKSGLAIVIEDGRIAAVVPDTPEARAGRTVIDGRGRTAMPALIDMHVHLIDRVPETMKLFLANGVLFVRDMGTDQSAAEIRQLRADVRSGRLPGPEFLTSGRTLDRNGRKVESVFDMQPDSDIEGQIRQIAAEGWDFLKVYNSLTADQYARIHAAARASGLKVGGHVPFDVSLPEAIVAGQWTVEHARDLPNMCTDPLVRRPSDGWTSRADVVARFRIERCAPVIAAMRAAGTGYVPTHVTRWFDVIAGSRPSLEGPEWAYVSPDLAAYWKADIAQMAQRAEAERKLDDPYFQLGLKVTREAVRQGLTVMAGSDANDSLQVPGFSLHNELAHLVRAGLSPLEAIRAATVTPARFLGVDRGVIAPGKAAAILLVEGNPLVDIGAAAKPDGVFDGRRFWGRKDLDRLLADVRARHAGAKPRAERQAMLGRWHNLFGCNDPLLHSGDPRAMPRFLADGR